MLDAKLLGLYREAFLLKGQRDEIARREEENLRAGIASGYLSENTNLSTLIEKYQERVKEELQRKISEGKFEETRELLEYLIVSPLKPSLVKKGKRPERQKESIEMITQSLSAEPLSTESLSTESLPEEIYQSSISFAELVQKVKEYRERESGKRLTWKGIAEQAGMSYGYMVNIKKGDNIPSEKFVKNLAQVLNGDSERFLKIASENKKISSA